MNSLSPRDIKWWRKSLLKQKEKHDTEIWLSKWQNKYFLSQAIKTKDLTFFCWWARAVCSLGGQVLRVWNRNRETEGDGGGEGSRRIRVREEEPVEERKGEEGAEGKESGEGRAGEPQGRKKGERGEKDGEEREREGVGEGSSRRVRKT